MQIILNGNPKELGQGTTVGDVLRDLGAVGGRVAVLVNGEVLPAKSREMHALKDGDCVEIIGFAAGG